MENKFVRWEKKWAEIVAKAWLDEGFKKKLFSNPEKILKEQGMEIHAKKIKIFENNKETAYLVFPQKPEGVLSEHSLKKIIGGVVDSSTSPQTTDPCVTSVNC